MNFFDWFKTVNNQYVGVPIGNQYQCMGLMNDYVTRVLGLHYPALAAPTAVDSFYKSALGFTRIHNLPWNVPIKGDIVYFGSPFGAYLDDQGHTQYAGHVCVFNEGNVFRFTSIDQNWPLNSSTHVQSHTYFGCLGWLRKS